MKNTNNPGPAPVGPGSLVSSAAMRWQRAATQALRPLDLTPTQYLLLQGLRVLSDGDLPITQASVARHVGTDVMLTSKHLRALEKMNLLDRRDHPTDTRARSLEITKTGAATLKRATKEIVKVDAAMFGTNKGIEKLSRTLEGVIGRRP